VSPSSLRLEEHLLADAKAEEGLGRAASATARPRRFRAASACNRHRALPGEHHAVGGADAFRDPPVISTATSGATCASAFCTERRLPIP
jgi:hypothetical protein